MKKLSHEEITDKRIKLENIEQADKMPVAVLLNSIRSSYNVGSIFRTSDAAMVKKLYLCGYTPTPEKKEVLKTALGAQDSVDWEFFNNPLQLVKRLKEKGYKIAALELTENSTDYTKIKNDVFPLCLIVGNEISGVSQELIDECDFTIELPQYGIKQSLNVGVAYGISIFKLREIYENNKA